MACSQQNTTPFTSTLVDVRGKVSLNGHTGMAYPVQLNPGDRILTPVNSLALLSLPGDSLLMLYPLTEIEMTTTSEKSTVMVTVKKGSMYASLRGTMELALALKDGTRLVLREGTADIASGSEGARILVKKGKVKGERLKSFVVNEGMHTTVSGALVNEAVLSNEEQVRFQVLAGLGSGKGLTLPETVATYINAQSVIDPDEMIMLEKIKTTMGPLSVVELRNGKRLIGFVRVSGSTLEVITGKASHFIGQKEVKTISRYSGI